MIFPIRQPGINLVSSSLAGTNIQVWPGPGRKAKSCLTVSHLGYTRLLTVKESTSTGTHLFDRGNRILLHRVFAVGTLALIACLAFSCASLNLGQVEPADLCKCSPLDQGIEYRHDEKHVPIPDMAPQEITIDTIYSWRENDPGSLDPPRTGVELQVFHVAVAFVQEVSVNSEDCDVHVEISQTADKNARRVIVETPVDSEFCSARKNLQAQLAKHGVKLDPTHGGELPNALPADVVGLAFLDFDHEAIGLGRGSPQVGTLWELHPAIVNVAP